ncbi:uncharacterized protein LOC144624569 [Crassostrea virginica]
MERYVGRNVVFALISRTTGCGAGYDGTLCKTPCPDGLFGPGCLDKCNIRCRGCNRLNGYCENGCLAGWKGNYCHIECDFGTYGDMCNETCGKCRDQTHCHHTNGTCLSGCSAEYDGALCNKRMGAQYTFLFFLAQPNRRFLIKICPSPSLAL